METGAPSPLSFQWQRRLLTIMVADAVGYSRLMSVAEEDTHARMRALLAGVTAPCVIAHRGEIVKGTGDGFIAHFDSSADAVRCAIALQGAVQEQEAPQPPDRRIVFRVGLNVEDVIIDSSVVDTEDIFGDGVNIAVRLEHCAPPGGIVVSAAVRERLDAGSVAMDDLGELRLKNIRKPIRAFSIPLPGVDRSAAYGATARSEGRAQPPTLAILPLRNLSLRPDDAYLCSGVVDDIIVSLSGLKDMLVIARGSTTVLSPSISMRAVSQRLGVRYVLGGSMRRGEKHLSFTFELTDVEADAVIWADRFTCGLADVFDVQDHIVGELASRIASHVRQTEIRRVLRKRPETFDAYDHLLKALNLLQTLEFENFTRARGVLDRAMELDDDFAATYACTAQWYIFNIGQGWSHDTRADAREALRFAEAALARDPLHAQALAVYGHAKGMCFRDYDSAIDCFDRALALSPNNPWAWMLSSGTLAYTGNASEAIGRAQRALRLSPIDQYGFYHTNFLALALYCEDSFDEAITWCRKSYAQNPNFCSNLRYLAASFAAVGSLEAARTVAARHGELQPRFTLRDYAPRCPFKDEAVNALWLSRLRSAGFPD